MGADEPAEGLSSFVIDGNNRASYIAGHYRRSRKRASPLLPQIVILGGGAVFSAIAAVALAPDSGTSKGKESQVSSSPLNTSWLLWIVAVLAILTLVALTLFLIARRQHLANENRRFNQILKAQEEYKQEVLEKLRKETELATLMGLNQGQINEYHRIVTEQADKAFRSSRVAMGVGLLLLISAAFAGAYVPLEQVRWFIGALAVLSTTLSGYLAKTYLALYKESISQLNRYFDQPVLNSHYLTAERLAEALDREDAIKVRRQIIDEVLAASTKVGTKEDASTTRRPNGSSKPKRRKPPKRQAGSSLNG
ncbi:hypothetical protein ACWCQB_13745 [Streptomyces hirsutus]